MHIDVCMPTWNSAFVIAKTLNKLAQSERNSKIRVNKLIIVDNFSEDKTLDIIGLKSEEYGWNKEIIKEKAPLPIARKIAMDEVESEWFLFLDDDVRLSKEYLNELFNCIAPSIGGIQGRKSSSTAKPWEWAQRRIYRGGTHATFLRSEAVKEIDIPVGVEVLEDEYIRRVVEENNYIWIFNHKAIFIHDSMDRHPLGWKQGVIGGKYNLMPFHSVVLFLGEAVFSLNNIPSRIALLCGWIYGSFLKKD